jgi:MFS family permease
MATPTANNISHSAMDGEDPYHARLRAHPVFYASIGVLHTLLTAGVVFGWASLLPILRQEGIDLSPSDFARIFTHGAIGNYLSSLPFGLVLDRFGPKSCGMAASFLLAVGLALCSFATQSTTCLDLGFALVGFSGPAVQLPTLHLARLFPGQAREGGTGGAALLMSAQAGAFDGGTIVFALFSAASTFFGMTTTLFFRLYLLVPLFTFLTAVLVWPHTILPDPAPSSAARRQRTNSYLGAASPYLSPGKLSLEPAPSVLKDAPLSQVLSSPPFYCLALWVAVHILKLNFVVASINDQLNYAMKPAMAEMLIGIFGAILPFGFVVLPGVAYLLSRSTITCFQVANVVGVLYGSVLAFLPGQAWYQIFIVFTSVATSRQLVYSTVFHQTGELFGFRNYGVLLGLTNVVVSAVSLVQGPLVEWAESAGNYLGPNVVLLGLTLPLFALVYGTIPRDPQANGNIKPKLFSLPTEVTPLTALKGRPRSHSDAAPVVAP